MNKLFQLKYAFILAIGFLATSCLGLREEKYYSISANNHNTRFNISMNDLVYLGDVTGTANYSSYLGFIKIYNNNTAKKRYLYLNGSFVGRWASMIMYDNIGNYEEGEVIMPIFVQENSQHMFLGSKITVSVKAKVYKFKK